MVLRETSIYGAVEDRVPKLLFAKSNRGPLRPHAISESKKKKKTCSYIREREKELKGRECKWPASAAAVADCPSPHTGPQTTTNHRCVVVETETQVHLGKKRTKRGKTDTCHIIHEKSLLSSKETSPISTLASGEASNLPASHLDQHFGGREENNNRDKIRRNETLRKGGIVLPRKRETRNPSDYSWTNVN